MPGILQGSLHVVFHLVLTKTLCFWNHCHHFANEVSDAQRG